MNLEFRPLAAWPYPDTERRRSRYIWRAGYADTLRLLQYELGRLEASAAIIGTFHRPGDIRRDGLPRSDARIPPHPGVEISFDTPRGRLVYATDACELWEHNVRSIGLGLEALRAVDRHGITRHGEQYAGFLQLETSAPNAARGEALVEEAGGIRAALMRHHPDQGGDPRAFADVQAYRAWWQQTEGAPR